MTQEPTQLPPQCRFIDIPMAADERGCLAYATAQESIPFAVRRVFWIYDVPPGAERGGHMHRTCDEVVFALSGGCTIELDDAYIVSRTRVSSPTRGLLIPAGEWCRLTDFQPGTVLAVLASQPYDAQGYLHDHDKYVAERRAAL